MFLNPFYFLLQANLFPFNFDQKQKPIKQHRYITEKNILKCVLEGIEKYISRVKGKNKKESVNSFSFFSAKKHCSQINLNSKITRRKKIRLNIKEQPPSEVKPDKN